MPPHSGTEVPTRAALHRHVDRLLRDASAYHRFPTPIDDPAAGPLRPLNRLLIN